MPFGVGHWQGSGLPGSVDKQRCSRLTHIATQDATLHVMSKMGTDIVACYQCHGAKYFRIAVTLRLVVHGHNGGDERWWYKHTFGHCRQLEELTVVGGQLGVSELVSCRRASDGDLINMPGTWIFPICRCPHCFRSQILAKVVSVYSRCVPLRQEGYGIFRPTLGKDIGCSVQS